jgi:hypothetical protein
MHTLSLAKLNALNASWYAKLTARLLGKVKRIPLGDGDYAVVYVMFDGRQYYFDEVTRHVRADPIAASNQPALVGGPQTDCDSAIATATKEK